MLIILEAHVCGNYHTACFYMIDFLCSNRVSSQESMKANDLQRFEPITTRKTLREHRLSQSHITPKTTSCVFMQGSKVLLCPLVLSWRLLNSCLEKQSESSDVCHATRTDLSKRTHRPQTLSLWPQAAGCRASATGPPDWGAASSHRLWDCWTLVVLYTQQNTIILLCLL